MTSNEYRILAYARSEMDPFGTDFVIVLRSKETGGMRIHGVLLGAWKGLFNSTSDADLEYLQDFIYDLRQQSHLNNGSDTSFFESLDDLSIGPLRTSSSGRFERIDLASVHTELSSHSVDVCSCSEEAFEALAQYLKLANHQLTAATSAG